MLFRSGQLQLVAETMEPVGAGSLQLAFEQLRDKLKAEGLFDQERKRALPAFPRTVAIVTSPTGAVIRDFLNIVSRRHWGLNVVLVPAAVQGEHAPAEIEAALAVANRPGIADLIVLARGGGSLEDLAAFNSERVARAIAASALPVVSAVGHETDFTIADFVADLRAPTPSAAAELVTAAHFGVAERVERLRSRLRRAGLYEMLSAKQHLQQLSAEMVLRRAQDAMGRRAQKLDELAYRAESAARRRLRTRKEQSTQLDARLRRQHVALRLSDDARRLQALHGRLIASRRISLADAGLRVQRASTQLAALSPLRVLERGYALVYGPKGKLLRSTEEIREGESVIAHLHKGRLTATVTKKSK